MEAVQSSAVFARGGEAPVVTSAPAPTESAAASEQRMARAFKAMIPTRLNLVLATFFAAAQLYILAGYALGIVPAGWPANTLLVFAVLTTYSCWVLIHEAIHSMLSPSRVANHRVARVLSVLHGSPFAVLKIVHLLHHKYNRVEDYAETYDPAKTSRFRASLHHYYTVLAGRYWSEVLACFVVWLPQARRDRTIAGLMGTGEMGTRLTQAFARKDTLREARTDAALVLALLIGAFVLARHAPLPLVAALAGRALLISFFDDAYHYGTARNLPEAPQPARNHALGPSWIILHFNHHGLHHRFPSLPWKGLAAKAREEGMVFDGHFVPSALRQLRGPIALLDLPAPAPLVARAGQAPTTRTSNVEC